MKLFKMLLLVFPVIIFSCTKGTDFAGGGGGGGTPAPAQTNLNVSYGADAAEKMDMYLPAGRTTASTKVIILLHGGAWATGDKTDLSTVQFGMVITDTLKARFPDYAIFNLNYRLSTGTSNLFPAQENDVKDALQFIYNNAAVYGISDKYVFIGESAGAHLAMLQAYKYINPLKPKVVVSLFGPTDLIDMYNNPAGSNPAGTQLLLSQTVGGTPTSNPSMYTNSSPINYITSSSPPTIFLHGSADPIVNASQSLAAKNKLAGVGVNSQYVLYTGKGHGDDWGAATYHDAFDKIETFIKANM
jgi:acetyl esterase/lipase